MDYFAIATVLITLSAVFGYINVNLLNSLMQLV